MTETHPQSKRSLVTGTWSGLLILFGLILIGMAVGSILGVALISAFEGDGNVLLQLSGTDQTIKYSPVAWMSIITVQAVGHLFAFLIPSLIYWVWVERRKTRDFNLQARESYRELLPIFFLTIALMPFTGLVAEWNEGMKLPDAFSGIEAWMKESETTLSQLTEFLMSFETYGELAIAILVIAVIPAIGEELLFRGILQRKLAEHWANVHVGIWVSALIFSAIHVQFYGFFPRLFLGAMFGYLYFWTGRLGMAVFAHFVNNAVTVLFMWLHKKGMIEINIESAESIPLWMSAFSLILSIFLLRAIYRASSESEKSNPIKNV